MTVDVVCTGRFYDFFEKRGGKWGIVRRQPIYEKDRMDPVDPSAQLKLDPELLGSFPEGYRHLAYLQTQARLHHQARSAWPQGLGRPGAVRATGARGLSGRLTRFRTDVQPRSTARSTSVLSPFSLNFATRCVGVCGSSSRKMT